MKATQYAAQQIRTMCMSFKDRAGGTKSEWECQSHIHAEMERYADSVTDQEINVHPDVGWAWIIVVSVSALLSILLPMFNTRSLILATVSFALSLVAVAVTVFQFLLGFHMLDRFFPERKAKNVIGTVRPKGKTTKRIVFAGHADAAYEFTYSHYLGPKGVLFVAITASIGLIFTFGVNTALLIKILVSGSIVSGSSWFWLRMSTLIFAPAIVSAMFFFNTSCIVDGVNDNLSGCAVAMATLKEFSRKENRLDHTEVCCLTTSSEEIGLRGAHAFAKGFSRIQEDVETVFVVLDTLHDTEELKVYTQGMNGFQQNSPEVASLIKSSAKTINLPMPEAGIYPGATDAEAFSRAGLKACAICGVDHTPQAYYHTRADNLENLDEKCLGTCLQLCLEIGRQLDGKVRVGPEAVYLEAV